MCNHSSWLGLLAVVALVNACAQAVRQYAVQRHG